MLEWNFELQKCVLFIMKKGKRETIEEIEVINLERIWKLPEKENYKE